MDEIDERWTVCMNGLGEEDNGSIFGRIWIPSWVTVSACEGRIDMGPSCQFNP